VLYFGYGSNLDAADRNRWCAARSLPPLDLTPAGIVYLPDRRLAFTHRSTTRGGGVLDVPPAVGCAVAGVVYRAGERALEALDRKESEGHTYRRVETVALDDAGNEHEVVTYEVEPGHRETFVDPAPAYVDVVRRGYAAFGVDAAPLEAAACDRAHAGSVRHLFVYGTLMSGELRYPALARHGVRPAGAGRTSGMLLDFGEHPGLVLGGDGPVYGEIYDVPSPEPLFRELDAIEDFKGFGAAGSWYRRAVLRVSAASSGSLLAWTYLFAGDGRGVATIASGDWRRREDRA
jgi:gamma-glutamylcyclotransferase (GGCT)/AIG2-like uncharacterized protein YtfP